MKDNSDNANGLVRLKDALLDVGIGRSTLYARVANKTFPPLIKIGASAVGFRRGELDRWLADPINYRAPEVE